MVAIVGATPFCFPQHTAADTQNVKILDLSDKSHFDWVANGQSWFNPSAEIVPTRLVIKRLNVDIAVGRGGWDGKDWKIDYKTAFFAPQLNQKFAKSNDIFMYGHNVDGLLAPTKNLLEGDELMIKLDSGPWVKYFYTSNEVVEPTDVSALTRNKTALTLLACHGATSDQRRIMHFTLKN